MAPSDRIAAGDFTFIREQTALAARAAGAVTTVAASAPRAQGVA
jgi:hypothetical protein